MKIIKYFFFALFFITLSWGAQAVKITSTSQLLSGSHAKGVIGDYLLWNDSVSFVISDIPNTTFPGNTGGLCIDAALSGGIDDLDLFYLYLNKDWPRQGNYHTIEIISAGAPYDSAHIRVKGVDSDNANISIISDYILYDDTPVLRVKTRFYNHSATALNAYGIGDAFSWGSNPFVPGSGSISGGNSLTGWIASTTSNTLYGYMAMEDFEAIHGTYWSDATLKEVNLAAGDSVSMLRYFMVSNDLIAIYSSYLDLWDIPAGSLSVFVYIEGEPAEDALVTFIHGSDAGPTLEASTDSFGRVITKLSSGIWLCRVNTGSQTKEKNISITADSNHDLSFFMDAVLPPVIRQDTLTIIQSPIINIPTLALPGDTISVQIDLPEEGSVQSLALLFNADPIALAFEETFEASPFGLRTFIAGIPQSMLYGLYDLKIQCTGSDSIDISENAVYILPEYKDEFTFIHVTDTHLPSHYYWGDPEVETDTTEIEDFRAVIDDINIIHPDFVLHTGDLINDGELEALGTPAISRAKKLLLELEVPLFMVSGNHDLGGWISTPAPDGTARRTWWNYFGWKYLSNTSTIATTTQNYSFNYGNTHFVGLEAYDNYDKWRYEVYGDESFTSTQLEWLNNDLSEHSDADLTILFYHYDFKHELDLSTLGVDAAFWGHIHSNTGNISMSPLDISTGATCDGNRWYRIVTVENNIITSMQTLQAGYNGELITKSVSSDKNTVTLTNNSSVKFENCVVTFPLENGKKIVSLSNAVLMQIDSLSAPKTVYAYVDLPANNSVEASITVEDIIPANILDIPDNMFLALVYPNPFNPKLVISYQLSAVSLVDVSIYNMQGKIIDTLFMGEQNPGEHKLIWNAGEQASGLYFIKANVRNSSGTYQAVEKCLLMK